MGVLNTGKNLRIRWIGLPTGYNESQTTEDNNNHEYFNVNTPKMPISG